MKIRTATIEDLKAVTAVETACFPSAEAAKEEAFRARLLVYPEHFWILQDGNIMVGFVNGMVTNELTIRDEMFEQACLHQEDSCWQTIFGINTIPEYRRQGCAAILLEQVIAKAKAQGRKGCILTCKEQLIHYYAKFGYKNCGRSGSIHGGAVWYDMRLEF